MTSTYVVLGDFSWSQNDLHFDDFVDLAFLIGARHYTRTHFTFRDNNRLRLEYVERRMVETGSHMSPKVGDSLSVIIQGEYSKDFTHE